MRYFWTINRKLILYTIVMSVYSGFILSGVSHADIRTQAIVMVYSEGKVMATYEATDRGRMDNDCYVFHIKKACVNWKCASVGPLL